MIIKLINQNKLIFIIIILKILLEYSSSIGEQISTKYTTHYYVKTVLHTIEDTSALFKQSQGKNISVWNENWQRDAGIIHLPYCPSKPSILIPTENKFYCTLPYNDLDEFGRKASAHFIPWAKIDDPEDKSILKNRWIRVSYKEALAFCQLEDVGPETDDDFDYVFGPSYSLPESGLGTGLGLSPEVAEFMGIFEKLNNYTIYLGKILENPDQLNEPDEVRCSWQFYDDKDVPDGPWKDIVTTSTGGNVAATR
ncbi:hypothetical protein DLAC_04316 [Tieghemostelium lacteum]|uniref:Uncharacterized protein n=1 Tax=Tieghemostelium lacteum TaxID=361077 RepID=A0A151ZJ73_TIELA|nr:hypothetical protein DLAC_04316 [Tieghemostelium lacteum]|eukprot:KYQ94042.1 hypothetical protein DLAC_04316 [Tieghemostelium lacteum]